jgi:pyruvate/2-oxoglutarate/acetoin dehydrogenase E1 component
MPTVLESLNTALHQAFSADERVYLLGEDLLDPYGGAFKVARGLSDVFPDRVLTTPISEAGFTGLAVGMALRGLRPVVEIMFGDFLTLAADQLINHAAKFGWMYSGGKPDTERVMAPLVVRAPMGGRRGYGPTHSQTLEKHFLGAPGLHVLAASAIGDPRQLLLDAILHTNDPLIFVENKLLYLSRVYEDDAAGELAVQVFEDEAGDGPALPVPAPAYIVSVRGAPPAALTLAAYGYMAELARQALLTLAYDHEVFAELVVFTRLAPLRPAALLASLRRTSRLLAVEEAGLDFGWGAEILARAAETPGLRLRAARRLAALNLPIPASGPLESLVLPSTEKMIETCLEIVQNG